MGLSQDLENATMANADVGSNSAGAVFPTLFLIAGLFFFAWMALGLARSLQSFRTLMRFARIVKLAGENCLWGALGLIPLAAIAMPAYWFSTADASTQTNIIQWVVGIFGGAMTLSAYGYFVRRWWARVKTNKKADEAKPGENPVAG